MGFVIRKLDPVIIRLKDLSLIKNNKEALDLLKNNEAQKRTKARIIIYSEIDFNDFYRKHCARIPNDKNNFTVLVWKGESIPTRGETRRLLEELLGTGFKIERGIISVDIPKSNEYRVRNFYNREFLSAPSEGSFRFRDIDINFSKQKLESLKEKKILAEEQYEEINNKIKESFTDKGEYFFEGIWLIGHTDVTIKKKRLFF